MRIPWPVRCRIALPIANLVACAQLVWLREPDLWYLAEVDKARQHGDGMFLDDTVVGTLACRTLTNWGPIHGGEEIGVAALEVLNLPSLLFTGIVALFGEAFGLARVTSSACQWSWLLAGVFIVAASVQWWYVGSRIDTRRWHIKPIWLAYAAAPLGALPVAAAYSLEYAITEGEPLRSTGFMTFTAAAAYFFGLLLLPLWRVFEKMGWRGWRYYVPTGACAGIVIDLLFTDGTPEAWDFLLFVVSGTACAIVFSVVLARCNRVVLILLAASLALPQVADAQLRPPLRTVGPGYDGVIIDRSLAPGVKDFPGRPGAWIPTESEVRDVETRLPVYLAEVKAASGLRHPRIQSELSRYKRQYWGEIVGRRRLIRILFYHQDSQVVQKGRWLTGAVSVMGGGDSYFQVTYEMDRGRFTNLWVNAPE